MKFTVAAFLAAFGFAEGKKLLNKKALLRNAIPVDKNGNRRLEQEEFEINGLYSIKFNHCLSVKIAADDYEDVLFSGYVIDSTKAGKVLAQTSYVLFNVCVTENCYYDDDESLYMVDLPTYMGAIVEGQQQEEEAFCQACEESYETCYPNYDEQQEQNEEQEQEEENQEEGEEEQQEDEQQEGEEDGEQDQDEGGRRRRLQNNNNQNANDNKADVVYYENQGYRVVDCDTCEAKGCFDEEQQQYDENNANWQITDEVIDEWIQEMLECSDTEILGPTGEDNLYAGFMCNEDGTGVQPAIFLDDNCAVYTSLYSYGNLVSGTNNYDIMYQAADLVTQPFNQDIDCEYIEWVSIEDEENMAYEAAQQAYEEAQNGNNNNNQEEEEVAEAAEVCRNLMEGIDLKTCDGYEEDYNEDEEEDVYEEGDVDYSWYTYLAAADAADDAQEMCVVVAALQGEYGSAHTYTEDDGEGGGSGHVYDYKSSGSFGSNMNAGKIFGIIIAVIVVIVAAVLIMQSMGGKKDAKKVPLVNNKSGAMA